MTAHRVEIALIIAGGVAGWWLLRAWLVPHAVCRWCHGTGNNPLSSRSRQGDCLFCHGRPRRMTRGASLVRGQGWRRGK
jgi:hypothetical protein